MPFTSSNSDVSVYTLMKLLGHAMATCDSRATPVLDPMGRIEDDERWGIGVIPGARFKGGWGPSVTGEYLVRQFGLIPSSSGTVAVALAAESPSGSFSDVVHDLDTVADCVASHVEQMPAGTCTCARAPAATHIPVPCSNVDTLGCGACVAPR